MPPIGEQRTLNIEEFRTIRDYIHEKSGMFFGDNKLYLLQSRLSKRMEQLGVATYRDYFYRVKYDTSHREFDELMNLVTTNETYYLRNEPQLEAFATAVLPEILETKRKKRGPKTLRIWSAGCSTGEEPYTLGIIVREALRAEAGWNVEIIANDISEQVLQRARTGEYEGATLRYVSADKLNRYFDKTGETYRVKQDIKSLVKFVQLNLNDTQKLSMYKNLDVIFCRNVMIYFSDDVKRKIVRAFYQSLAAGGQMLIGHSETLHGISKAFKLKYYKGALVYVKDEGTEDKVGSSRVSAAVSQRPVSSGVGRSGAKAPVSGATKALELLAKIKAKQEAQKTLAGKIGG